MLGFFLKNTKNAYNHSYHHWIALCIDPMRIVLNARSNWDELPPYDHHHCPDWAFDLKRYASPWLMDLFDAYTYYHLRTHFLYTAEHFYVSRI